MSKYCIILRACGFKSLHLEHKDITFYKKESYVFFTKKYANMSMRQSEFV